MNNADESKVHTHDDVAKRIVLHHLSAFQNNDLTALMSDYTAESVFITQDATYTGRLEIEAFLGGLMAHFPKQLSTINLDKMVVDDHLAYIVWHAKTPSLEVILGSDTLVIRGGKIHQQTFAGLLKFLEA